MKAPYVLFAAAWLALAAVPASAEVIERDADHFVLQFKAGIETTPEDIYGSIADVGQWWNSAHTYSGKASNLSLTLEPGACFCEALDDGAIFEHGTVVEADPDLGILLDAPLGPLKGKATMARLSIGWTAGTGGWEVVMTYVVRGPGIGAWADGVDAVMGDQYARLLYFVEYGAPPADDPA